MRLILASASRGRKMLMEEWGVPFEVIVSDVEEPIDGYDNPRTFVQEVSFSKAKAVAERISDGIIVAADTIGWMDGKPLLKPDNRDHAFSMIHSMQGHTHELWTGMVVWEKPSDHIVMVQERSLVRMAPLTNEEINNYLDTRIWQGCSGSYAVQRPTDPLMEVISGTIENVIGLPIQTLQALLKPHGF